MPSRRLRLVARVMLAVLLLVFVCLAGGVYLLHRNSEALTAHVLEAFTAATGFTAEAASVDIVLLPVPTVFIGDVHIRSEDLHVSVAYASLRPSFWKLLRGDVWPAHVQLLRPVLTGKLPLASLTRPPDAAGGTDGGPGFALPPLPGSLRLEVQQGQIDVTAADGSRLVLDNLGLDLDAGPHDRLDGEAHWSLLRVGSGHDILLTSRHVWLEGGGRLSSPLAETSRLHLKGRLQYGDWLRELRADLQWKGGGGLWAVEGRLDGALTQSGQPIPFSLDGSVRLAEAGGTRAELTGLNFTLDADSGRLDGVLHLPGSERPRLSGHLSMHRLSLTQWLGFARDLVPGLQLALDNITGVAADFELDGEGLRVPAISAGCSGSRFSGTGGVPRWDKPVVTLELAAQQVDLGLAIPEAVGQRPRQPAFPYAPLTSFDPRPECWDQLAQRERPAADDAPDAPSATDDLGYDIRLSARQLRYGPLRLQDAHVNISPGKPASTGLGRARLDVRAALYDGTLTAQATIGGGPEKTEFDIAAGLKSIKAAPLGEHLPALPLRGGRLQAEATLRSVGGSIPAFLANLSGKAAVRADSGSLPEAELDYDRLALSLDLRQGRWKQGRVGLNGAWNLSLEGKKLLGTSRLDGTLWLGGDSRVALEDCDARVHLTADREFSHLPQGLDLNVLGRLSARVRPPQLALQHADINALGAHYAGSLTLSGSGTPGLSGSGRLRCDDLPRTLSLIRESAPKLPQDLRALHLQGDWEYAARRFALKNFSTRLLDTDIRGETSISFQKEPHIRLALSTPLLDIDALRRRLNPEEAAADARREEEVRAAKAAGRAIPPPPRPASGKPWDLRFLQTFSLEGSLHAARVLSWKLTLTDARLPFKLNGGRLDYDLQAKLYGAVLHNTGHAQFDRGLRMENHLSVNAFDLAPASAARGGEARVSGKASVEVSATAALNASGQMPAAINGSWKLLVRDGMHQPLDKQGRDKGKPTRFSLLSASGNLRQGVARSGDLSLRSADMNVMGGGWINLVDETLDCSLRVDTPTMNNIPVRVYGSLHDVKTSISAGTVLLYALSGIAQGITGLVGGLLDGALGLFR